MNEFNTLITSACNGVFKTDEIGFWLGSIHDAAQSAHKSTQCCVQNKICTFCAMIENDLPLFTRNDWLTVALGEKCREVTFNWEGQPCTFSFQYHRSKGRLWAQTPDFVPFTSISGLEKTATLELGLDFIEEFRNALPKHAVFHFRFPLGWTFEAQVHERYTVRERLTHCLAAGSDLNTSMKSTLKRNLKKAEKAFEVGNSISFEALWMLVEEVFKRQNMKPHYGKSRMQRIFNSATELGGQRIYTAVKDGEVVAVLWVLFDQNFSYNFMSGAKEEVRSFQPNTLLLHRAISEAFQNQQSFDFFGSSIPSIQRYVRSWGAEPVSYFAVEAKPKLFFL